MGYQRQSFLIEDHSLLLYSGRDYVNDWALIGGYQQLSTPRLMDKPRE
jgi:hypothetical protein